MAQYEKGLGAPQIDKDEHVLVNGVNAKRVLNSGYDGTNIQDLHVDSAGDLQVDIVNTTIEQTTGATHNDLNIAVAGKDDAGKVQPLGQLTTGTKFPLTVAIMDASGNQITSFGSAGGATETTLAAINTALQTGGISQTQFAAMVTALQVIDNFISGSEAQVDVVAALPAGTNIIGYVGQAPLLWLETTAVHVDATTGYQLYDCSEELNTTKYISICNAGTGDLFVKVGGGNPVKDGSTADYDFRLATGETRWLPIGYNAGTANDVSGIRAAAQTNHIVMVTQWGYGS
jgi:hypothetical protein